MDNSSNQKDLKKLFMFIYILSNVGLVLLIDISINNIDYNENCIKLQFDFEDNSLGQLEYKNGQIIMTAISLHEFGDVIDKLYEETNYNYN